MTRAQTIVHILGSGVEMPSQNGLVGGAKPAQSLLLSSDS